MQKFFWLLTRSKFLIFFLGIFYQKNYSLFLSVAHLLLNVINVTDTVATVARFEDTTFMQFLN